MKKSLIALAVAGAVAAPTAFAATSNVEIYGVLNVSLSSIDSDVTGEDRSTSLSSNSSRVGFKGTEDLGGGLKALWQVESTVNTEEGGGFGSGRNTFVGLGGGFGTVLLGKHDTPFKLLGRKVENFADTLADSRNLLGTSADTGSSMFNLRTDNTIVYISPNLSGVTVIGAYVTDHTIGSGAGCAAGLDCNERNAYSVIAEYANGPLMLGVGYERQNTEIPAGTDVDRSMWRLVAGYTLGDLNLGALYENGSADAALADADRNGWGLFANYTMGNVVLKGNYLSVGDYDNSNDTGAKQYTIGVDYMLSKRTTVYGLYAKLKNDDNAFFDLGAAQDVSDSTSTTGGDDPSTFTVGVRHSF